MKPHGSARNGGPSSIGWIRRGLPSVEVKSVERASKTGRDGPEGSGRRNGDRFDRYLCTALFVSLGLHVTYGALLGRWDVGTALATPLAVAIIAGAALLCLRHALPGNRDRNVWLLLGLAISSFAAAGLTVLLAGGPTAEGGFSSLTNAFATGFYPLAAAAMILLLRHRSSGIGLSFWLDGMIAGLAVVAVGSELLFHQALPYGAAASLEEIALPIADMVLLGFLFAALGAGGWNLRRASLFPLLGLLVLTVTDLTFLHQLARGEAGAVTLLDSGWPAAMLLFGLAALGNDSHDVKRKANAGWPSFAIPAFSAAIAAALLIESAIAQQHQSHVLFLAAALMVLVIGRLFLSLRENAAKEKQLVNTRDRFRTAFEHAPVAMVTVSLEPEELGRYVDANPAFCELLGYSLEEITQMTAIEVTVEEHVGRTRESMHAMADGDFDLAELEKRYRRKDGSTVWVQINAAITHDASGRRRYSLGHVYDISSRKLAEQELRRSEERYREIVETTSEGVWVLDAEQRTTFVNPRMAEMLGYRIDEVLGRPPRDFKFPDAPEETSVALEERRRGFGGQMERVYVRKDGSTIWTLNSMSIIRGEDGSYQGALAMVTDISERKANERRLEEGSRLLAEAQRLAHLGSWEWSLADNSVLWSDETYRIFGLEQEDFHSSYDAYLDRVHPDDRGRVASLMEALPATPERIVYECRIVRPDGQVRVIETRGEPVLEGDRPVKVVGTALDVTDRRRAEDDIRRSHALSSSVIDSALDCVVIIDSEGRVTEFNPAAEATFGYTREQALGAELAELIIPPQLRDRHREALARVVASGAAKMLDRRVELDGMRADGTIFPVELAITRVSDDPPTFTGFLRDISERKRSERELELRAEQQAAVAMLGREALAEADIQQLMDEATEAVAGVLGVEFAKVLELSPNRNELVLRAAVGLPPELVGVATVPAGTDTQAGYTLTTQGPVIVEDLKSETRFDGAALLHDNGAVSGISVVIEGSHGPFGVIAAHSTRPRRFTVDEAHFMLSIASVLAAAMTRRRADGLELRLNQAQRLESVGQLAGGIAHDFNNLLSIIINYASFAIQQLDDNEQARDDVKEVEKAAKRAAELTRQLLTFSRRELVAPEVLDINELVTDTETLLRHTVGKHIRFHMSLSPELWRVRTGATQFEQMLINLILNARDAMVDGGELELRTDNVELDMPVVSGDFRDPARPLRPPHGLGHRRRDVARGGGARIRALLHDQATGQGNRPRPGHRLRNREAGRRLRQPLQRAWKRHRR